MAIEKVDELKQRIREALRGDDFQRTALGLCTATLSKEVASLFKKNGIRVTLISVEPAYKASLADFAAIWKSPLSAKQETSWFNVIGTRR